MNGGPISTVRPEPVEGRLYVDSFPFVVRPFVKLTAHHEREKLPYFTERLLAESNSS